MAEIIKIQKKQQLLKRVNLFLIDYFKTMTVIVLLLILLIGYFFILLPRYRQVANEVASNQRKQLIQQTYYKKHLESLERLNQTYNQLDDSKLKKVDILLPETPQAEQLMMELQKITNDNGLVLNSLMVEPEDKNYVPAATFGPATDLEISNTTLGRVRISLSMLGLDYQGLKNFLAVIESNLRLMDVTSVIWAPDGGSVQLEITAYYLKR